MASAAVAQQHQQQSLPLREEIDPLSDPEERRVLFSALDSFRQYRHAAHFNITHLRRQSFYALPSNQIELLSSPPYCLPRTFDAVDCAIDSNADICDAILKVGLPSFGLDPEDDSWMNHATPGDLDKARSTIRQLYRDWSAEGSPERHASHFPIFNALEEYLPEQSLEKRHQHRILIPGAGLGRLVLDLCAAGYTVEGNEISYHQLLVSNYMLNHVGKARQHELYPWALSFSNHVSRSNQLQSVSIPDVHPADSLDTAEASLQSEVHYSERLSMTMGDFCVLYQGKEHAEAFDAVATCFFVDTAPNVIKYIKTVQNCLRPGGIWINLGPLLWHFESTPTPAERNRSKGKVSSNSASEFKGTQLHGHIAHGDRGDEGIGEPGSFELSNEEVVALVQRFGFVVLQQKQSPAGATGYIQDAASMLQNVYRPSFWVAQKPG